MNRQEHLQWCKDRANAYLDEGDIQNGITSMLSDMNKHPKTRLNDGGALAMLGVFEMERNDLASARRFVDGFR